MIAAVGYRLEGVLMPIRLYQPADQSELLGVWERSARVAHHFLPPEHFEQERRAIVSQYLPVAEVWVYEYKRQVVGFIALLGQTVGGFFVDPTMQGRGLGRALMDYAVQLKGGLAVAVFAQNTIGRHFYNRYGFIEMGVTQHTETGMTLLHLHYGKPVCSMQT